MKFDEAFYQLLQRLDEQLKKGNNSYYQGTRLIYNKICSLVEANHQNTLTEPEIIDRTMIVLDDFSYSESMYARFSETERSENRVIHNFSIFLSKQLILQLRKLGVEEIPCAVGDEFTPHLHNAKSIVFDEKYKRDTVGKFQDSCRSE